MRNPSTIHQSVPWSVPDIKAFLQWPFVSVIVPRKNGLGECGWDCLPQAVPQQTISLRAVERPANC